MKCACIQSRYDFYTIAFKDFIVYLDLSDWIVDNYHNDPVSYTVEVKLPELEGTKILELNMEDKIYPSDLGFTFIKDGIYTFTVLDCGSGESLGCCGEIYVKKKLLTPNLDCCLLKAYANTSRTEELKEIISLVEESKNAIELEQFTKAADLFKIAKHKLKEIECECQ